MQKPSSIIDYYVKVFYYKSKTKFSKKIQKTVRKDKNFSGRGTKTGLAFGGT
jgi:hypothetical protein